MGRPAKSKQGEIIEVEAVQPEIIASVKISKANWETAIVNTIKKYQVDPSINSLSCILPIGLLAKSGTNGKVENMRLGWTEDFKDWVPLRLVSFSIEKGPHLNGIYTDFSLELFKWDGGPPNNATTGITHELQNKRGNVVIRQTVATEKKLKAILETFLTHASKVMIENCKLPKTIKKA